MDRMLLDLIQSNFPIEESPYAALGERLNLTEEETLALTARLRDSGLIKRIGPFFDSKRLGFRSTLVAARVEPEQVEQVAAFVNEFHEVTHNYLRAHGFNLWFTLIASREERIEEIIASVRRQVGVADIHNLPSRRMYKIHVDFSFTGEDRAPQHEPEENDTPVSLDEREIELIRLMQHGIPFEKKPFEILAKSLNDESEWVIGKIRGWKRKGMLRRFGAALSHRQAGFSHNAMVVWEVAGEDEDRVGKAFASHQSVSHCYLRPPFNDFPFSLYTMIHGQSSDEIEKTIECLKKEGGLGRCLVLESCKEYKKSSPLYF
jgi:siroheme decarboxylase